MNPIPVETVFWPARRRATVADPVPALLALGLQRRDVDRMMGDAGMFGTMSMPTGTGPTRAWVFLTPPPPGEDGWSVHVAAAGTEARTSDAAETSAAEGQRLLGGDWAVICQVRADMKALGWVA